MTQATGMEPIEPADLHIALVVSLFNDQITSRLRDGALSTATEMGLDEEQIDVVWVPGAFELPQMAQRLAETGIYDAIACLGAVIRGETPHFDFVAGEAARGVMTAALGTGIPITFGVITADSLSQAEARAGGAVGNKGSEAMYAALHMGSMFRSMAEVELANLAEMDLSEFPELAALIEQDQESR